MVGPSYIERMWHIGSSIERVAMVFAIRGSFGRLAPGVNPRSEDSDGRCRRLRISTNIPHLPSHAVTQKPRRACGDSRTGSRPRTPTILPDHAMPRASPRNREEVSAALTPYHCGVRSPSLSNSLSRRLGEAHLWRFGVSICSARILRPVSSLGCIASRSAARPADEFLHNRFTLYVSGITVPHGSALPFSSGHGG